jgi:HemY protein
MRTLISISLLLIAAIAAALWLQQDPGSAVLRFRHWQLETSAVVLVIVLFAAFYVVHRLFNLLRAVSQWKQWRLRRSERHAHSALQRGLKELGEGRWHEAEKRLSKSAKHSATPFLHYLAAAEAAQQRHADQERDTYLEAALQSFPSASLAVGLTQVDLQTAHGQAEQALATLLRLYEEQPKHSGILARLARVLVQLKDWERLQTLLPALRKYDALAEADMRALEQRAFKAQLERHAHRLEDLQRHWKQLPHSLQKDPELVGVYADRLAELGHTNLAAILLSDVLKKKWDEALARRYGQLESSDFKAQMKQAERWTDQHPESPAAWYSFGLLRACEQDYTGAQQALEKSQRLRAHNLTARALSDLFAHQGNYQAALTELRKVI